MNILTYLLISREYTACRFIAQSRYQLGDFLSCVYFHGIANCYEIFQFDISNVSNKILLSKISSNSSKIDDCAYFIYNITDELISTALHNFDKIKLSLQWIKVV